jgi:hypothetical protein
MNNRGAVLGLLVVSAAWSAGSLAAQPAYVYTTTVHLSDGKTLSCGVNEPASAQRVSGQPLTRREQTEADVLATQRLRLLSGPTSAYPSPLTAPDVVCTPVA